MYASKLLFLLAVAFALFSDSHGSPLRSWRRHRKNFAEAAARCFFEGHFGALSVCEIDRALTFWDEGTKVYTADASVLDKAGLGGALNFFCNSFGKMKFSNMIIRQVDHRSFVTTLQISEPTRLSAPVNFSDAFTFRYFMDKNYRPCARAVSLTTTIDPSGVQKNLKK